MRKSRISKTLFNGRHWKKVVCVSIVCVFYYVFGVGDYMFTRSFDHSFEYPLNINIRSVVEEVLAGNKPDVEPINYYPYKFLTNSGKCKTLEKLDLFIIVKSALGNFDHREAIRKTYGQENGIPGRIVKTLFFLGIPTITHPIPDIQRQINNEKAKHKDIIQMDFHDHYFNNTIKSMMSFRWLYEHCSTADFYLFTDDDMYISVNNLLDYAEDFIAKQRSSHVNTDSTNDGKKLQDQEHMYAGYVFESSPLRHKFSKWRVSLEEYPWNRWPPYVTAGAYVVSNKSMKYLYVASLFVKHFRFDDIYLGIVAKKVGIEVTHCPQFYYYRKKYTKDGYKDVIASHGFQNHQDLLQAWREQNVIV